MAVKIRLKRLGKKKKPVYRVVVMDSKKARDSKTIEEIGFYDPSQEPAEFRVEQDRATYWLGTGAQPTDTVGRLLTQAGVLKVKSKQSSNQKVAKKDRKKSDSED